MLSCVLNLVCHGLMHPLAGVLKMADGSVDEGKTEDSWRNHQSFSLINFAYSAHRVKSLSLPL